MFALVKFDNGEFYICPSSNVHLKGTEVSVSYKCRGRFGAKVLCQNRSYKFLNHLMDDIKNKRMHVKLLSIEGPKSKPNVRKILFESDINENSMETFEEDNIEKGNNSLDDYEIIEVIHDKRNENYNETFQLHDESDDSISAWLADEQQEQEQWHALLDSSLVRSEPPDHGSIHIEDDNDRAAAIPKITVLRNVLMKAGTSSVSSEIAGMFATEKIEMPGIENHPPFESTSNTSIIVEDYRPSDEIIQSLADVPVVLAEVPSSIEIDRCKKKSAKKHSCLFCEKLVVNLPRHLRALHMEEERVRAAVNTANQLSQLSRNDKSNYRSHSAFEELRKQGDLQYNHKNKLKKIITVRNSPKPEETTFVCCPLCKGFYSHKCFKNHFRNCHMREEKKDVISSLINITGEARVNGQIVNNKASPELLKYFFPYFTKPEQAKVLFQDDTAVEYGNKLVTKYYRTNAGGKHHIHIASQLRLLADIFINAKIVNPNIKDISDLIHPKQYDNIIKAIQLRCGYNNGIYKAPTTASNACTLLLKVSKFLKCEAIKRIDNIAEKQYTNFEYLLAHSQNQDVTRQAQDNKTQFQRQKKEVLPTTEEINCLLGVLDHEVTTAYEQASYNFNRETYTALAKAILAFLLAFNRKRPGDVEKTQLLEIVSISKVNHEHFSKLPDDDKKHAEEFARYITQGKLNKKASNLIPKKVKQAIDLLVEKRHEVGIPIDNPYLFARVGASSSRMPYFKADESLRLLCQRSNLDYGRLNANKLRKHLATCTAMLPTDIQNVISDFMGHTMAVHKNVYQQKEAHTDIVVMGKVLLDASGLSQKNKSSPANVNYNAPNEEGSTNEQFVPTSFEIQDPVENETSQDDISNNDLSTILEESHNDIPMKSKIPSKSKRRLMKTAPRPRRTWQTPEKREIRRLFQDHLNDMQVPSIHEVQNVLVNERTNLSRNAIVVRSWLHSEVNRLKRSQQGIRVQRWTTPERHKVRNYFKSYFDTYRENSIRNYPTNEELQIAAAIPEFRNKNAALLRSKIQHEFTNIDRELQKKLEGETSCSSDSSS